MKKREYMPFMFSWFDFLDCLEDHQIRIFLRAIRKYAESHIEPDFTGSDKAFFSVLKARIDFDNNKFEYHSENGKQGGRPKKQKVQENESNQKQEKAKASLGFSCFSKGENESNQKQAKPLKKENEKEKEKENENENITTTPPTPCEGDASAVVTNDFLKNHPEKLKAVQDEAAKCGIPITEDQQKEWYDHYSRWTDEEGYWVDQHDRRYRNWRRLVGGKWLQKWREEYEKRKEREEAMRREEELQRKYEEEEKERQRQRELNGEKEPQEQYSDDEPPF